MPAVYGRAPQEFGNALQMNAGSSQASGTARAALILGEPSGEFADPIRSECSRKRRCQQIMERPRPHRR